MSAMERPVVLDIGSQETKVGFSDLQKNNPDIVFDSKKALQKHESVSAITLLAHDTIVNWDQREEIAAHALRTMLKVRSTDHPLLLIEKPGLEPKARQRMVAFAFEELDVPAFSMASEPLMALYSVGLSSGIVLSSGHAGSNVCTVHDGHRPPYGRVQLNFGGRDVTESTRTLVKNGLGRDVGLQEAEEIKCKYGYLQTANDASVSCSDSNGLEMIGKQIGELLFNPGKECKGFHEAITRSVYLADEVDEYEPVYFRNIMLCGGNTLYRGIKERMELEIKPPDYLSCGVRVIAPSFRQHAGWIGGSVAASLPTFKQCWITKEDYAEYGKNVFRRKCLPF